MDAERPVRVLIADDSNSDRLLLKTMLQRQGHEVLAAADGAEAVELFQSEDPELVFIDALMPVMDGFEATERIKALAGENFVPVIFLTSLQEAASLARCLEVGGDDFINKPYNPVILRAKMNAFSRMRDMHITVREQRDRIAGYNQDLLREQEFAKRIFDKVAHAGCLDLPNIQYSLSPLAVFNGDVVLASTGPAGNLVVLLGDFTGHGLAAAIGAMPLAQTFYGMMGKGFGTEDILKEINVKLHDILPVGFFCCAGVIDIDFNDNKVEVWNGGLPDCFLYKKADHAIVRMKSRHLPLGIRPGASFDSEMESFNIEPGDRMYLWSDGIHEVVGDNGEMFGEERLVDVFDRNHNADELFMDINVAVNTFLGQGSASDDVSVVEVKHVAKDDFDGMASSYADVYTQGPVDWSLELDLRPDSLRAFNPLPLMLHMLMEVPGLRPYSGQLYLLLAELYSNALEHGVLGLESALKASPESFAEYYRLREQRLTTLDEGYVSIQCDYQGNDEGGILSLTVEDSGSGFDVPAVMNRLVDDRAYSGRGVALLKQICRSVEYLGNGNAVRVEYGWGKQAKPVN